MRVSWHYWLYRSPQRIELLEVKCRVKTFQAIGVHINTIGRYERGKMVFLLRQRYVENS